LYKLQDDNEEVKRPADFWIVTGLTIYVSISFFIFLFQNMLVKQLQDTAVSIWKIHDIAYIILCIFIAKAFYASRQ
jgi:hypothetical protein